MVAKTLLKNIKRSPQPLNDVWIYWILLTFLSSINWLEYVLNENVDFCLSWCSCAHSVSRLEFCCIWPFVSCAASLQAQLLDLRSELTEAKAERSVLEKELHEQLLQLHALQHAKSGQVENSDTSKNKAVSLIVLLQCNQWEPVGVDRFNRCFLYNT